MNGWQVALLVAVINFAALAGLCATAVPGDAGSAMPIFGLLFWFFLGIAVVLAVILGLTFLHSWLKHRTRR